MNAIFWFHQSDVLDLCPLLNGGRRPFNFQILGDYDCIAINQYIAVHIFIDFIGYVFGLKLKTTFRAHKNSAVRIYIITIALRAIW